MLTNSTNKHKRALSGFSELSFPVKQNNKQNLPFQQTKLNKEREIIVSKANSNTPLMKSSALNKKGKGSIIYANLPLQLQDEFRKKEMSSSRLDNSFLNNSSLSLRNSTPNKKFNSVKEINKTKEKENSNNNNKIGHARNLSGNGIFGKPSGFNSVASNQEKIKANISSYQNSNKKQNLNKNNSNNNNYYVPKTARDELNNSHISNSKITAKSNSKSKFRTKTPINNYKNNLDPLNSSLLDNCNLSVLSGLSGFNGIKLNLNNKISDNKGMNRTNSDFNKTIKLNNNNNSQLSSNSKLIMQNKYGQKQKIVLNKNNLGYNVNSQQSSYTSKIPKNKTVIKSPNQATNNGTNNSNDISTNSSIKSKIDIDKNIKIPEKKNLEYITQIPIRYKEPASNNLNRDNKFNSSIDNKNQSDFKSMNTSPLLRKKPEEKSNNNSNNVNNTSNILNNPFIKSIPNSNSISNNSSNTNIQPIQSQPTVIKKDIRIMHELSKVGFSGYGAKKVNQDNYFIFKNLNNVNNNIFMGVCDGHGVHGHEVSGYLRENLPYNLNSQFKIRGKNILSYNFNNILEDVFLDANAKLFSGEQVDTTFSGSTCVSLIYTPEKIITANVGDSRAVIGRLVNGKWKSQDLTRDHKPNDKDESVRIKRNNGRIEPFKDDDGEFIGPARVWLKDEDIPGLAMSRAFGDKVAASVGVIAEPEIFEYKFTADDKFFIIASDGVWEFIESEECIDIIKDYYINNDITGCCEYIHRESSQRWLKEEEVIDDITMIIVFFD